ncbi:TadE/TadG family type IV pilus assembly protein [Methylorubrum thiocyanatum]
MIAITRHYALGFKLPSMRKFGGDTRASVVIEFAFVGPLLIYLMLNIFVGAIYFGAFHKLQHIAAQAARASIAGADEDERSNLVRQSLARSLEDGTLLPASAISVTVASLSADRRHYRVSLSFETQALGLRRFPGLATVLPATLISSYDVRSGGL